MLSYWKESPFVRILLPFVAGIILYFLLPYRNIAVPVTCAGLLLFLLLLFERGNDYFKLRFVFIRGVLLHLLLLALAYLISVLHHASSSPQWFQYNQKAYRFALVRITAPPEPKEKSLKLVVDILQLGDSQKYIPATGKAIIYLQKDSRNEKVRHGDEILIKNELKVLSRNGNPGCFEYADHCATKNIFHSAYLKADKWQTTGVHNESISSFFAKINRQTLAVLKRSIPDTLSHGVAEALLLGYRSDIDEQTWQAYTNTGIVHIIAISGMHMAMVYGTARWLLLLIPFLKKRKIVAVLIALLLMWGFAFITGLPPSVCRAAIMFTFIGLGEMCSEKMNHVNALAASAFLMLCYDPMILQDVGFQLSYLAVLSLVIFYSPVYNLLYTENRVTDAIWKLMAMTIAAQILTFPICIYYFHQFPLLFLFTNLFAVPLTTMVLYTEILLVMFQFITPLAALLGEIISRLVLFINHTVEMFSHISFAVWSAIHISLTQMILLYLIIGFMTSWLFYRKWRLLCMALACTLIFYCGILWHRWQVMHQHKMIVYNVPNRKCIEFISRTAYFNPDRDSLIQKVQHERYILNPAHTFFSVTKSKQLLATSARLDGVEFFGYRKEKIMRIEHTHFHTDSLLRIDVLIVSKKCDLTAAWLTANIQPGRIVLDSSVPFWRSAQLKKALNQLSVPIHIVSEQGAFILDV